MINTVIFDIGNVLVGFGWKDYIRNFGFSEDVVDRLGKATVESEYWCEYDRGVLSDAEIINLFVSKDPELEKEIRQINECLKDMIVRKDYAIPWIKDLKARGYRVLYLSNFSKRGIIECADSLDFLEFTDGGVFSYEVKLIKPDKAIYEFIINKYSLKPDECVFLDDTIANLEAAKGCGFNTIHVTDGEMAIKELDILLRE